MLARVDSRGGPARTNGIEMIAGARIRRPCNHSLEQRDSIMCLRESYE